MILGVLVTRKGSQILAENGSDELDCSALLRYASKHLSPSMHMKSVLTEHGGFHVLVEMDTYFVALTPTTMDTGVAFSFLENMVSSLLQELSEYVRLDEQEGGEGDNNSTFRNVVMFQRQVELKRMLKEKVKGHLIHANESKTPRARRRMGGTNLAASTKAAEAEDGDPKTVLAEEPDQVINRIAAEARKEHKERRRKAKIIADTEGEPDSEEEQERARAQAKEDISRPTISDDDTPLGDYSSCSIV